jgi:murein DD-endopeptidase MepM/ murein hydrolase activator NlpD
VKTFLACCLICLPLKHLHLNSSFGYRLHPVTGKYAFHAGVDFHARADTVFAIMEGQIIETSYYHDLGITIKINHNDLQFIYGHLSQVFVAPKDSVSAGQAIGITGATGRVTGEHLHLAIRDHFKFINPIQFLYETLIKNNHE